MTESLYLQTKVSEKIAN